MKFSGTVLFLTLWFLVVYAPLGAHGVGQGRLLNASLGGKFPTLDFAGGTVVHISRAFRRWYARCISAKRNRISQAADATA